MSKTNQNFITIGGAVLLSFIVLEPFTDLFVKVVKPINTGGIFSDIGPDMSYGFGAFFYAFLFFLSFLEFFFKKPILERKPYLYIIGAFLFFGFLNTKSLLLMLIVLILGALPGTIFNWIKDKRVKKGRQ